MNLPSVDPDVTYSYDLLSRLTAATDMYGHYAQYSYDALGRRLTKVAGCAPVRR